MTDTKNPTTLLGELQEWMTIGLRGADCGSRGSPGIAFSRDNRGDADEMLVVNRTGVSVRVEDREHVTKSILGDKTEKIPHYVVEVTEYFAGDYNNPPDCDVAEAFAVPCRELGRAAEEVLVYILTLGIRQCLANEGEARYWQEQARLSAEGKVEEVWS